MFTSVNNPNILYTNSDTMKNLQTILEQIRDKKGWNVDQLAEIIGRKRGGYYTGFERKTITIWEFDTLSKKFSIEPNDFFEWNSESTIVDKSDSLQIDTNSDNGGEVAFLRVQIGELNSQIRVLNSTIHNLTKKN
jgi:hypothetical protein